MRTEGRGVQATAFALRTRLGEGGSKIGKILRTYFMDGSLHMQPVANYYNNTMEPRSIRQTKNIYIYKEIVPIKRELEGL